MTLKRKLASLLCLLLVMMSIPSVSLADQVVEGKEILTISNVEEFLAFAERCSYDLYSKNLQVELLDNIDLSGVEMKPIGIFCGSFDGNNHTISGYKINYTGSNVGLFRYTTSKAVIKSLKVRGTVNADGSMRNVGGLVGNNSGRLLNIDFEGVVNGKQTVGGIAGVNQKNGYIANSSAHGAVNAEHSTGGITGQNFGIVIKCENTSLVNTSVSDDLVKLEDIEVDLLERQNEVVSHTDSGGIVGYSEGIIQSCVNRGKVGYQHVGYNVGGIVGRHNGYLSNSENYGYIQGRKDVGGVAGQLEPYLLVKFSEDTLKRLGEEFDNLEAAINQTLDHTDQSTSTFNTNVDNLLTTSELARDEFEIVADGTTEFVDETVAEVNEISFRVSLLSEASEKSLSELREATEAMELAISSFGDGISDLRTATAYASDGLNDADEAFQDMSRAMTHVHAGLGKISEANDLLNKNLGDPEKMEEASKLYREGFDDLNNALRIMLPYLLDDTINPTPAETANIINLLLGDGTNPGAIQKISSGTQTVAEVVNEDMKTLREAFGIMNEGIVQLQQALIFMEDASSHLSDSMKDLALGADSAKSAMIDFKEGSDALEEATVSLKDGITIMEDTLNVINQKEDIVFPTLGSKVSNAQDNLFKHLDTMNDLMKTLNDDTKSSSDVMTKDLRVVNDQIFEIIDIIIQAKEVANMDESERFTDISAEDEANLKASEQREKIDAVPLDGIHQGYLTNSKNFGLVEGDVDTGGIAGAIAIEYDFDPEDDLNTKGKESLNFQYQTKAVVRNVVNRGRVTAKKDYAGGVSGRMDLGIIVNGENYGQVASTNGSYVGGIAGASTSIIKDSYVKCYLDGKSFVGGIAGLSNDLMDNYAQVKIQKSDENFGAISGKSTGISENNYFLNVGIGGIDNISYEGKTIPQEFSEFSKASVLPDEFRRFSITFKIDGEIVSIETLDYGVDLSTIQVPLIPEREGYYGVWPSFDEEYITFSKEVEAEYIPRIKSIADQGESGLINLIVEAEFTPKSSVAYSSKSNAEYQAKFDENYYTGWEYSIDDYEDNQDYLIRYKVPSDIEHLRLYEKNDNGWREIPVTLDGSYAVFTISKSHAELVSVNVSFLWKYILMGVLVFVGLVLLFLFIRRVVRLRKVALAKS